MLIVVSHTAYDEEDDGFVFTRKSRATVTRSAKNTAPEPPPKEPTPPPILTPPRQTKVRATKAKPVVKKQQEQPPLPEQSQKLSVRPPIPQQDENIHSHHYPNQQDVRPNRVPKTWSFEQSMEDAGLRPISPPPASPPRRQRGTSKERVAKVVIPLTDTPIIQRNKQFRKEAGGGGGSSSRRSSLGLRGRRASSLIDNGQVGMLEHLYFKNWERGGDVVLVGSASELGGRR